jgi:hypothetical protein
VFRSGGRIQGGAQEELFQADAEGAGFEDDTIGFMARFKPAGGKKSRRKAPNAALPCAIVALLGIALLMVFLYFALKSSGG